jgi:hypothetical protein
VRDRDDVSGAAPADQSAGQPTQPDPRPAPPAVTQPDQPDTPAQPRPAADTSQPQQTEPSGSRPTPHSPNPPPAPGPDPWPPIPTVEHIRTDNLQRTPRTARSRGARWLLYRATRGKINPGLSAQEKYRDDLHRRARTLLRGNYRIGVVGKGGAGKTTARRGGELYRVLHPSTVRQFAFSSDGAHIATVCTDNAVRVWAGEPLLENP